MQQPHVVIEINTLVTASKEWRLEQRARADRFQGVYRDLMQGSNELLDAILLPIAEENRILAQISEGRIDEQITQLYQGDHEKMKVAVNKVGTVLLELQWEIANLIEACKHGQLAERGKAENFQGAYSEIVQGLNEMLDAIFAPVSEGIRVYEEYAKTNFSARMSESLYVSGDFLRFKEALNNIGVQVSTAFLVVLDQITHLASSAEQASAHVRDVASGSALVAKSAAGVSTNTDSGEEGIRQVLRAMEDLTTTVSDVATKNEFVSRTANSANQMSKRGAELATKAEQGMDGITRNTLDPNSAKLITMLYKSYAQTDVTSQYLPKLHLSFAED
jgi:methyl-accepting chemotaxis protein